MLLTGKWVWIYILNSMYRYGYHTFLWTFGITTFWHLIKCLKSLNRWVWLIPSELYQFQFVSYGPACIRFCCFVVVFFKMCSKKNFNWKCEAIVSSFSQCLLLQLHGKSFHINVEMLFMTEGLYYIMWACSLHMVSHTMVTISHINFTNLKFSRQLMKLTNGSSPSRIIPCSSSKVFTFTSTPRSWSLSCSTKVTCSQKRH